MTSLTVGVMHLDYVSLPHELAGRDLSKIVCVVLDVLRATTSMAVALDHDALEIRTFPELDDARAAWQAFDGPKLLAGERHTRKPDGFDLGNRPPEFTADAVAGKTLFMATTNGTRAIRACASAGRTFVASLANASAMAQILKEDGRDVVFVCSGVDGKPSPEDIDGAATIADAILRHDDHQATLSDALNDAVATGSWLAHDFDGPARLLATPSGQNILRAGLEADLPFIARVDFIRCVGEVRHESGFAVVTRLNAFGV